MFEDEQVLDWCIENGVTVEQYLFMYFLIENAFHKPFHESYARRYVKKFGLFKAEIVQDLVERGYVEDFNTPGKNLPEFYKVRDEVVTMMKATDDQAEELWQLFPATFDLPNGASFVARRGGVLGDKDNAKKVYLSKIGRSKKKHKFVLEMCRKYIKMVAAGKTNSMKLGDWIADEMWDTISKVKEENIYGIEFK
jgi:hypothetical protein